MLGEHTDVPDLFSPEVECVQGYIHLFLKFHCEYIYFPFQRGLVYEFMLMLCICTVMPELSIMDFVTDLFDLLFYGTCIFSRNAYTELYLFIP